MTTRIKLTHSSPSVFIDGCDYGRLAFKTFRAAEKNISAFYDAGVRLFNVLTGSINCMIGVPYSLFGETWVGDGEYDFSPIDRQMELFIKNAPEGYFSVMLQLDARPWYCERHGTPDSFKALSQALADEGYVRDMKAYLRAAVRHCEEKYGDRIFGYFLLCGFTTEWFSELDYEEETGAKTAAYRRYLNDGSAVIPAKDVRETPPDVVYLDPDADRELISYRRFHAGMISSAILGCAAIVKDETHRDKLCGVYFGYLFELAGARLWNAGSLDYERVFDSPDIDMISSPSSYSCGQRSADGASGVMVTHESLTRREKLYFLEFDHRTFTAPKNVDGDNGRPLPGWSDRLPDERTTIDVMRRDFMLCATQRLSLWWFDMFGGWFDSPGMMDEIARQIRLSRELSQLSCASAAEIALIASGGESLYLINKNSGLNSANLTRQLADMTKIGAPFDIYSSFDVEIIDFERYKVIIFPDLFDVTERQTDIIRSLKEKGKTLIFLGASPAAKALGAEYDIAVRENTAVWDGQTFGTGVVQQTAAPVGGEVIARFKDGAAAAARRDNVILAASGPLPTDLIRGIARDAGVFIYSDDRPVYVSESLIGVYLADGENTVLRVREDGVYEDVFSGRRFEAKDGRMEVRYAGSRAVMVRRRGE